jgi:hypothetical protein
VRQAGFAALLLLGACAADQAAAPGRATGPRATLEDAVARLPAEAAEFRRGATAWHERTTPGLGASTDYAGPARAAVATASIYDRGQAAIPQALVERELEVAEQEALEVAERRTNHRLASRERFVQAVPGGAPLACSRLESTYGRQPVQTVLCVGEAAGRFLKVQVTSPARQVRPAEPIPYIVAVTRAVRGG